MGASTGSAGGSREVDLSVTPQPRCHITEKWLFAYMRSKRVSSEVTFFVFISSSN